LAERLRLLWISDAAVTTGFARLAHALTDRLCAFWDIHMVGINYHGEPHTYPYAIYPAHLGGDLYGIGRLQELCDKLQPSAIVLIQDPWIVQLYLDRYQPSVPVLAYMPVDACNQGSAGALNSLALAVFYTQFGLNECRLGGYTGPAAVIPHGVDRTLFCPHDRLLARQAFGDTLTPDTIVVGAVNRNQFRKRLDLLLMAFAEVVAQWPAMAPPLKLLMHTHPHERVGYNLAQLSQYLGIGDCVLFPLINPSTVTPHVQSIAVEDTALAVLYAAMDMHVSTTLGEGFGLTQAESLACGIPNIVPRHSALAEWMTAGTVFVEPCMPEMNPGGINTIGQVVHPRDVAEAILTLATDAERREQLGQAGAALMADPRFNWDTIAGSFNYLLEGLCLGEKPELLAETLELAEPLPLPQQEVLV
jgi:D-inositol-3-phosphate glycosyltransferase